MKKKIAGISAALLLMGSLVCSATVAPYNVDVDMQLGDIRLNSISVVDDGYCTVIQLSHMIYVRKPSNSNKILQVDFKGFGSTVNGISVGSDFDSAKVTEGKLAAKWRHGAMVYYTYILPDGSIVRYNTIAKIGTVESITRISKTLNDINE
jgi:hypothetical protein